MKSVTLYHYTSRQAGTRAIFTHRRFHCASSTVFVGNRTGYNTGAAVRLYRLLFGVTFATLRPSCCLYTPWVCLPASPWYSFGSLAGDRRAVRSEHTIIFVQLSIYFSKFRMIYFSLFFYLSTLEFYYYYIRFRKRYTNQRGIFLLFLNTYKLYKCIVLLERVKYYFNLR